MKLSIEYVLSQSRLGPSDEYLVVYRDYVDSDGLVVENGEAWLFGRNERMDYASIDVFRDGERRDLYWFPSIEAEAHHKIWDDYWGDFWDVFWDIDIHTAFTRLMEYELDPIRTFEDGPIKKIPTLALWLAEKH